MERACPLLGAVASLLTLASASAAQTSKSPQEIYAELKRFELGGGRAPAQNVVLMRDRAQITFATGTFYFAAPVAGKVRGAVFIGQGNFKAEVPNSPFERDHVRRMLKADTVESDFSTAVLRFTDDTFDVIGKGVAPGAAEAGAVKLASEFEARCLKETGANMASRLTISIVNQEAPGFFLAEFDKGKRGRFSVLLDYQTRIPVSAFSINGGEKGLIYAYNKDIFWNDVWMAFYGGEDYQKGIVNYSDAFDLVEIKSHKMDVDLREPAKRLKYTTELGIAVVADGLRALPLALNEGLGEYDSQRLKKALRVKGARLGDGKPATVVQEDWQAGLVVFFESPRNKGELFSLILDVEGDFMYDTVSIPDSNYPLSNETWFPRHGELARSSFDLTFVHKKNRTVASIGARVREEVNPENKDERITQWVMTQPVPIATFGIGPFERHAEKREIQQTGGKLDVEFYSLPGGIRAIKEDFILAELGNTVNYFDVLFGAYPYPRFGAIFHPFGYGIGYPSMLRIPSTDRASKYTYSFLAHETAHQWWGNIVAWRSYRDQWLSEGFAEYSGLLYTSRRDKPSSARELLISMRADLKNPPQTLTGLGKGKLSDVGPIILGHRLNTRESLGAYQALIYSKGGLVLRMLHFLFSNPANGDDKMFYGMMKDFVDRYRNGSASSDDFRAVANEHWPQTRLAQKYGQKDLNWFFRQWVYQTHLPTYRMEYKTRTDGGAVIVEGTVFQDNAPQDWFMPLPLVFQFEGNQTARGTVHALGPATPFAIKLPAMPRKIELDPDLWVLSEETSTKGK